MGFGVYSHSTNKFFLSSSLSSDLLTCQTHAIDRSLLPRVADLERGVGCEVSFRFDDARAYSIPPSFFFTPDPKIRTVTKTLVFLRRVKKSKFVPIPK